MAEYTRFSGSNVVTLHSLRETFGSGGTLSFRCNGHQVLCTRVENNHENSSGEEHSSEEIYSPESLDSDQNDESMSETTQPESSADEKESIRPKRPKIPSLLRKLKANLKLSKLIQPKPALMLLYELKPSLVFNIIKPTQKGEVYMAEAVVDGKVLGQGQGLTKNNAKHEAAEKSLKTIVKETLNDPSFIYKRYAKMSVHSKLDLDSEMKENVGRPLEDSEDTYSQGRSTEGDSTGDEMDDESDETGGSYGKLPWASLASYALFRMFNDWKKDGFELPQPVKPMSTSVSLTDIELPENASEMHPVSLLNQMIPALRAEELQRTAAPHSSVTVGYRINEKLFTGTAKNAKAARKIAATHVCRELYGVNFVE